MLYNNQAHVVLEHHTGPNHIPTLQEVRHMADQQLNISEQSRKDTGSKNHNWRGGFTVSSHGYLQIFLPDHQRASQTGYVYDHILRAEKALGKPLPQEAKVHHANGTKTGPLVICQDEAYHQLLHRRMRALKACGHANWRKCSYCKQYDDPKNMFINKNKSYHKECRNQHDRKNGG